eukprot:scaffold7905_cov62-Phaeocystis_antarctica.AAC.5
MAHHQSLFLKSAALRSDSLDRVAEAVVHEGVLGEALREEALGPAVVVDGGHLLGVRGVPWQRADHHVLDDVESALAQPRPQRVQGLILVEVFMRAVVDDDVKALRQCAGSAYVLHRGWRRRTSQLLELLGLRGVGVEEEVHARVGPHRAVILAAKLGLVLRHALRVASGLGALGNLLGRLDVDEVDLRAREVLDPRGGGGRGVLADAHLEDGRDRASQRAEDRVVGSRVVMLGLPKRALVAAVLVQELSQGVVCTARSLRAGGLARPRLRRGKCH